MTILNLRELKKIIEHLPDDYEVTIKTETSSKPASSIIEIDTGNKQLILK